MAEETQEIYYDIEAAMNVLTALDTCDAQSVISADNVTKMKKDALYIMMRSISCLADTWRSVPKEKKKTED